MDFRIGLNRRILFLCILMFSSGYTSLAFSQECKGERKIIPVKGTISTAGQAKAEYPSLAKVSCIEAIKAAADFISGKVIECELEDEDGFLVYGVEIVSRGKTVEVQVDAGNGRVLSSEEDKPEKDILEKIRE